MARSIHVLVVWELGAHLGHLLKLKPVVLELLARGHQVTLLVPDVEAARCHLQTHERLHLMDCPRLPQVENFVPHSYAEIIEHYVLPSDPAATDLFLQWQRLLAQTTPDVMLVELAPAALLAARLHGLPVLALLTGWGLPRLARHVPGLAELPMLPGNSAKPAGQFAGAAAWLEAQLLARANRLLQQAKVVPLESLGDLYSGAALTLLCTFPELDHFGVRPDARYVGSLYSLDEGVTLSWPTQVTGAEPLTRRPRVFVYLQPHRSNNELLRILSRLNADVIAYLPRANPQAVDELDSIQLQISNTPVRLQPLLSLADLVVSNGGHGLLSAALLAGVPLIVFPMQYEQALLATRGRATGAVAALPREEIDTKFEALAKSMLQAFHAKSAALAFATKYARYDVAQNVRKLANSLEELGTRQPTALLTTPGQTCGNTLVQIEITTKCNFQCFYCAGRHMKQEHMPWQRFEQVLQQLGSERLTVSLQGEGEPTSHPNFWAMVDRLIALGHQPYTITNASLIDVAQAAAKFASIGVSLDTLDEAEAQRIGRYKLSNVLQRLTALTQAMGAARVLVHTVNYGQDLKAVTAFVRALGAKHVIQPIQTKPDYAKHYDTAPLRLWRHAKRCRYLEQPLMRYFAMDGREAPCCYIKDMSTFETTLQLRTELALGRVPATCIGCREIAMPTLAGIPKRAGMSTDPLPTWRQV